MSVELRDGEARLEAWLRVSSSSGFPGISLTYDMSNA